MTMTPSSSLNLPNDAQPAPKGNLLQPNDPHPHPIGTQLRETKDAAMAQAEVEEAPAAMPVDDPTGSKTKLQIPFNHWQ
jgi:hypothetical protein